MTVNAQFMHHNWKKKSTNQLQLPDKRHFNNRFLLWHRGSNDFPDRLGQPIESGPQTEEARRFISRDGKYNFTMNYMNVFTEHVTHLC